MPTTLELVLLLLATAVVTVALFRRLALPPILAYILIGAALGLALPYHEEDSPAVHLAEFGVVFLMFSIGLEFSLAKLKTMRNEVFVLGGAQVVLTTLAFAGIALAAGWPLESGLAVGAILAMSSTAIVSKLLAERNELDSDYGRPVIGVLLFQDLAVAPLVIFIPALAASQGLAGSLLLASVKAAAALALILIIGQRILRPWFHLIAQAKSSELFMLNVLLITLALAYATDRAGLSLALGAFLAGVLISETEYRYQVESDIRPFRDVLMGLFFVSIGLLLDLEVLAAHWAEVLAALLALIAVKLVIVLGLVWWLQASLAIALRAGLALAQAGEFGFVLLSVAGRNGLVDAATQQYLLAAMILSMLAAPLLVHYAPRLARRLDAGEWSRRAADIHAIATRSFGIHDHVILCGYGRTGQSLARLLEAEDVPYIALDHDPKRVAAAAAAGENVVFGESTRLEVLLAAGLRRAKAVVITFAHTRAALHTIAAVQSVKPELPIIVRTVDETDLDQLRAAGATEVVPEVMEGALMLGSQTLLMAGVPLARVLRRIRATREERYAALRGYFRGLTDEEEQDEAAQERLVSIQLTERHGATGKTLAELGLEADGAAVVAVRRRGIRGTEPSADTRLQAGDILVLRGTPQALALAEMKLTG
ncbi:MAG: cation:proton antiporter [Thiobacillaceae bacterium]|nr:cation:proton antiporter [Thiobacillaceae bacterium]